MNILKIAKERVGYLVVAVMVAVAVVVPGLVSAAQVTQRSIGLSNSSASATAVSYEVKFTVPGASADAGAIGIEFCANSPDPLAVCDVPTGMATTGASSTSVGFTTVTTPNSNSVVVAGTTHASDNIDVIIEGITNPTAAGPLYARIGTYVDATAAATDVVLTGANAVDGGGVAISITPTIGVSGAVLESLTFCVASKTITENCGDAATNAPVLKLGEPVGTQVALDAQHLSTGTLFTQISTNAVSGAVVYLKSSNDCGGLKRVGASVCDIAPALATGTFAAGQAEFGVKTGTATGVGLNANGLLQADGVYDATNYRLNWFANALSGITGPIGDPILNTGGAPVNNQVMPLTFGASVTNSTPAGNYATSLSLIATGKF